MLPGHAAFDQQTWKLRQHYRKLLALRAALYGNTQRVGWAALRDECLECAGRADRLAVHREQEIAGEKARTLRRTAGVNLVDAQPLRPFRGCRVSSRACWVYAQAQEASHDVAALA